MAIEIGSLVVEMSANVARLSADVAQANRVFGSGMKQMQEAARHVQEQMSWVMGSQILHSFDLFARRGVEAFGAIKRSAIDTADDLNKLTQSTGFSAEALSGLKYAAELSDVGLEGLQKSLKGLSQNMAEAKSGNKEAIALFGKLGVSLGSSEAALMDLADRFAAMPDGFQKAALAVKLFGREGLAMIPFLNQGRAGIGELTAEAARFGLVISGATAAQAEAFNDNLKRLESNVKGLMQQLGNSMLPVLLAATEHMLAAKTAAGGLDEQIRAIAGNRAEMEDFLELSATSLAHFYDAMRPVIVGMRLLYDVVKGVALEGAAWTAQINALSEFNFAGFAALREAAKEDAAKLRADSDAFMVALQQSAEGAAANVAKFFEEHRRTVRVTGQKYLMDTIEDARKLQEALDKAGIGAFAPSRRTGGSAFQQANAQASAYDAIKKSLVEKIAAQQADLDSVEKLNAAEKEYTEFLAKLTAGVLKLTPAELADAAAKWDQYMKLVKLNEEKQRNLRLIEEERKAENDRLQEQFKAIDAYDAELKKLKEHGEEIGLTAEALNQLRLARLDDAIAIKERDVEVSAATRGEDAYTQALREQIAVMKQSRDQAGRNQEKELAYRQAKEIADEYARAFEDIQTALATAIFEGGDDGLKSLGDLIRKYMKVFAAQFIIRPLIQPVYAQTASLFGVDMSQAGGSWAAGGGGFNPLSLGSNLLGGSFQAGINTAAYSTFGGMGMEQAAMLAAQDSVFGFAGTAATLDAAGAAGAATAAAAMPYVAAAIAAISLFGGDLFGGEENPPVLGIGNLRRGDQPAWDRLADAGATGNAQNSPFGTLVLMGQHLGGEGGDTEALVAQYGEKFLKPIAALDQALAAMLAQSEVAAVAGRLANWSSGEFEPSDAGIASMLTRRLDEITDALGGWVNDLADTATGSLETVYGQVTAILAARGAEGAQSIAEALLGEGGADYLRQGETAAGAFVRLANSLAAVNAVLADLDQTAYAIGISGADMASSLADLFGGLDQFRAAGAAYYQAYFTEAERVADTSARVSAAMADLGLAMPATHAEFRALTEGLDLTTESGRSTWAALLQLAPAFDTVATAAEAAAAEAIAAAAEAARETGRIADERRDYLAGIVADQRQAALDHLAGAQDDLSRAYQAEYDAKRQIIDQFSGYLASLREYRQSLLTGDLSPLDPLARTAEAERQYRDIQRRAALGDLEAVGRLQGGSQAWLQNMLSTYGRNSAEYAAAFQDVQDALADTESLAERQIGLAQSQLVELRSMTGGLLTLNDSVLSVADAIANLRLAQGNVAQLGGGGGPSGGVTYNPAQSVAEQWFATYATSFSPPAETIDWWNARIASVGADAALTQFLNPNPSAPRLDALLSDPDYAAYVLGLPGHAGGGIGQGLFAAGERGTELIYSPSPVRVLSSGDSRAAVIDGGEVSALLKRAVDLLARVVEGQHADQAQRGAAATATLAELSDLSERVDAQRRTQRVKAAA